MSAAKMVEFLSREDRPLSQLVAGLPQYHVVKIKFPVPAPRKSAVLEAFRSWVGDAFTGARIDPTDGLKVYLDRGWVLVRASGTEPIFRIFCESKDRAWADATAKRFLKEGEAAAKG